MVFGLLNTAKSAAPVQKASAAASVIAFHSTGRAVWSGRDTSSLMRSGFQGNPIIFRAVKLISEAAAAIPILLQDDTTRYEKHPILELIHRPNIAQGCADLLEAIFSHLLLTGNAYIEMTFDQNNAPFELHVLRSDRMAVVPGRDGWPMAYEYSVSGRKHRFKVDVPQPPICHIKSFHPNDDHYGLSPLQAAGMAMDVHNAAARWSKALLDNAARPSGAIVYKGADGHGHMSNDQYERLLSEMETQHQGAHNAGRPMLLEGGLDWKSMGFSPSDMEFQKTKETAAREIATAFGVPPMLLGIPGEATYANYQEANRAFFRHTVMPLAQRVIGNLSQWLTKEQADTAALKLDLDHVPALAAERDSQWKRIAGADFLSDAEKRHLLGLPKLEVQND